MLPGELDGFSESELLQLIGKELTEHDASAFPLQPEQLVRIALDWLKQRRQHLESLICPNARVQALCEHSSSAENRLLVTHIAALLLHHIEVDATLVAFLLVRHGVRDLCRPRWDKEQKV
jgi:hypothetical protein